MMNPRFKRHFCRLLVIIVFAAFGSPEASAQVKPDLAPDFREVVLKMRDQYKNLERLHVVMVIQAFDQPSSSAPFYNQRAEIRKDHQNYLYQFDGNEFLMNERYAVIVDRNEREIMCWKRNLKGEDIFTDPVAMNIDSVLSFYGTPDFVGAEDDIHHYRLKQSGQAVVQMDLFINSAEGTFKKIVYHYEDGQYATIDFHVFNVSPQFSEGTFNENIYVVIAGKEIKPSRAFSKYRILNTEVEDETSN